ncbi:MAG TPA: hypothetical protein VFR99_09490 [Marmoricola sp.]|nr:hypothetical protein [Marmoricola sp.]
MASKPCCSRPCLVPGWAKVRGKSTYGYTCTNCRRFTPADGGERARVTNR